MLKQTISADMKAALKSGDKPRLATLRLILAAIKQREIDERTESDDEKVVVTLQKMLKQRRDSIAQYRQGGRDDLAAREQTEIDVISTYMPEALSEDALVVLVTEAISATDASSIKDMGKVMAQLKAKLQGRADMGTVSALVKQQLSG
jgi:uncharacterized protein YqeY